MKALTLAAMLTAALSSPAIAAAPQVPSGHSQLEVSILRPQNWTSKRDPSGAGYYEPLPVATEGRPGRANCITTLRPNEATQGLTQAQADDGLDKFALQFFQTGFNGQGVEATVMSHEEVALPEHKGVLIIGKERVASPPSVARSALTFYALPGLVAVALCTASDVTDETAEVAWKAWQATLLGMANSLDVQIHK